MIFSIFFFEGNSSISSLREDHKVVRKPGEHACQASCLTILGLYTSCDGMHGSVSHGAMGFQPIDSLVHTPATGRPATHKCSLSFHSSVERIFSSFVARDTLTGTLSGRSKLTPGPVQDPLLLSSLHPPRLSLGWVTFALLSYGCLDHTSSYCKTKELSLLLTAVSSSTWEDEARRNACHEFRAHWTLN